MCEVSILEGTSEIPELHSGLDGVDYDVLKVLIWLDMLKKRKNPVKWVGNDDKGTVVHFEIINDEEDYSKGLEELKLYIGRVNLFHGLELSIEFEE